MVQPVVFLVEQAVVPDPLPDLERYVLHRQNAAAAAPTVARSQSEPTCGPRRAEPFKPRRLVSLA